MDQRTPVEIHHIVPQKDGGPDDDDNAAPLCPGCHETHGGNPDRRKVIREARDHWYAICDKRFAGDGEAVGHGVVGHGGDGAGDLAERSWAQRRDCEVLGALVYQAQP